MSFFQENGVLTSRTSTGTDVVTLTGSGASLEVKAIVLTLNGATATGGANADYVIVHGFSDGTNERCVFMRSEDNVGISNTDRAWHDDSVISIYDTSGTLIDQGTVSAIGTGTFTINWPTTKSANAYKIGWTAWGGTDITGVEIGTFTDSASTGAQNVTTTLKSANFGMFINAAATTGTKNGVIAGATIAVGMATGSSNEGVVMVAGQNGQGTSNTHRYQVTDACLGVLSGTGTILGEADLTAFDAANGIQLNWSTAGASGFQTGYMLIKGGRWEVGNGTSPTSAITKSFTTTFQPEGLSTFTMSDVARTIVRANSIISVGATDGTSQFCFSASDQDNVTTTSTGTDTRDNYCVMRIATGGPPAIGSKAFFDSFNVTDFTLDWADDPDGANYEFIWVVCAADAVVAAGFVRFFQYTRIKSLFGEGLIS